MATYRVITTLDDDRWDLIAFREYGDPYGYERIIVANPHIPIHPKLEGGIKVWVPIIAAPPAPAPPWKRGGTT